MTSTIESMRAESPLTAGTSPVRVPPRWRGLTLYVLVSAVYFAIGAVLALRYNVFDGDGYSRVANAGYVTMSRDPHLSAVGFVWTPLPSLVEIPLVPLSRWWPELKTYGLAGSVQSAVFMAGATLMLRRIALDRNAGATWRRIGVACFALNPVIIVIGGSGLSEAATLFAMLWCVRYLLLWIDSHRTVDLAWAGIAMGVGYLARYDLLPTVCGVAALVGAITFFRAPREIRVQSALQSISITVFPALVAFATWSVTGWIVNGEFLAILSSGYGNASQVAWAHERGGNASFSTGNWLLIAALLLAMQPFAGISVAVAFWTSAVSRSVDNLVPLATFGSMLVFIGWGQYTGTTFNLFRYYLPAIPLVLVIALVCWTPAARGAAISPRVRSVSAKLGTALLSASLLIGTPATAMSLSSNIIGLRQPWFGLTSLFDERRHTDPEKDRRLNIDDRLLAGYLDRMDLPDGSVLMETFTGWLVWLASDHSRQFVITSDYDFTTALNRPWDFGIQYIVISNPGVSAANAILQRYPSMWADGAGIGELVYSANGPTGQETWRVYRVVKPPELESTQPRP